MGMHSAFCVLRGVGDGGRPAGGIRWVPSGGIRWVPSGGPILSFGGKNGGRKPAKGGPFRHWVPLWKPLHSGQRGPSAPFENPRTLALTAHIRRLLPRYEPSERAGCFACGSCPVIPAERGWAGVSRGGNRPPLVGAGGSVRGTQSKVSPLRAPLHTFRASGKYAPGGNPRRENNQTAPGGNNNKTPPGEAPPGEDHAVTCTPPATPAAPGPPSCAGGSRRRFSAASRSSPAPDRRTRCTPPSASRRGRRS